VERPARAGGCPRPGSLVAVAEFFLDDRGQALRVTWHAEDGMAILGVWRGEECVGTVRLGADEARRLAGFLQGAIPEPTESPTA